MNLFLKAQLIVKLITRLNQFNHRQFTYIQNNSISNLQLTCPQLFTISLKPICVINDSTVETNFIFVHPEKKSHKEILKKYAE
jgi:hypothetical protein